MSPTETSSRKRALSGIKPTGSPHLGNYLGMMRPAINLQEEYEAYYFVADYHALTSERDPKAMRQSVYDVTSSFLAMGLDPAKAVFFRQSDVHEVTELTWILSCVTAMGLLDRAHAYKAAKDQGNEGKINHGVFAYPVLMAADILLYDSHIVPVGKDQVQHLEMTRDIAQRFNHLFGETFVIPEALVQEEVMTIPGLDGRKMSKSYGNGVDPLSPEKKLRKRLMQVVTDSTPMEDPKDPDTCNVFALYRLFSSAEQQAELADKYRAGGFGYGHAKQALFEVINEHVKPYRDRYEEIHQDVDFLEDVLRDGARRARERAAPVLERVRSRCGYGSGRNK
ncbi:MAG: tryptophan--tRNA ligase [Myxococcales bacterium]|nr:tryptophan--tRNA ligase [Myxococcales bacterium]|tara:strand:- start:265 stop:1275 length:1011 start_codon:yes stop_codon:yes gene_type:complete